ncbi:MAG: hypothetical protein NZ521_00235 [Flammeovirgaceae bacterium]|nr:hypothetical protein [Flammeovirgaceae bacterium]MDW8286481.1 hypothetical protein [Flammeovirgaceae bacterium]
MKKTIVAIFTLFFLMTMGSRAYAQEISDVIEDPLGKPREWAALASNPQNDKLWEKYFGKDLFSLTKEENALFNKLKQHLLNKEKSEQDKVNDALIQRKIQSRSFRDFTKEEYNALVQNVTKNFPIIEDYFAYQYSLLGEKYVKYEDAYPTGEISKQKWVDEQEKKIEELKKIHSLKNPK